MSAGFVCGGRWELSVLCDDAPLVAFALRFELHQRPVGAHLAEEMHGVQGAGGVTAVEQLPEEDE